MYTFKQIYIYIYTCRSSQNIAYYDAVDRSTEHLASDVRMAFGGWPLQVWWVNQNWYPLVNKHSYWTWLFIVDFSLKVVIFHKDVKLWEGTESLEDHLSIIRWDVYHLPFANLTWLWKITISIGKLIINGDL